MVTEVLSENELHHRYIDLYSSSLSIVYVRLLTMLLNVSCSFILLDNN